MGVKGKSSVSENGEGNLSEENDFAGYEWRELPSSPQDQDSPPTYSLGGVGDGMGTVHVQEIEDDRVDSDWTVVYEFISEGEQEPISSVLGGEPDVHSADLRHGLSLGSEAEAVEYAEDLLDMSLYEVFDEYGVRPPEIRRI